jgi:hypothetical protein
MATYLVGIAEFSPRFSMTPGAVFDVNNYIRTIPIRSYFLEGSTSTQFKDYILSLPDVEMQLLFPTPETPGTAADGTGLGVAASFTLEWTNQNYPVSMFSDYNSRNPGGFLWSVYTVSEPSRQAYKTFLDYVPG